MSEERHFEVEPEAGSLPVERKTPVSRPPLPTSRRGARTEAESVPPLPLALRPTSLLVVGFVLAVLTWLGYQNPFSNVNQPMPYWPWDLFRSNLAGGGGLSFTWDAYRSVGLVGGLVVLGFLVLAIARSGPRRAVAIWVFVVIAAVLYWPDPERDIGFPWEVASVLAAAFGAGAVLRARGGRVRERALLVAGAIALLALLLLPRIDESTWSPLGWTAVRPIVEVVTGSRPVGFDHLLTTASGLQLVGLALLFVAGVVGLLGLGGRWLGAATIAVAVLTAFAPPLAAHAFGIPAAPDSAALPDLVSFTSQPRWLADLGLALAAVGTLLALVRVRPGVAVGAAGLAVWILAVVAATTAYRLGVEGTRNSSVFFGGLLPGSLWLGAGLGLVIAPIAAALVDGGPPRTRPR